MTETISPTIEDASQRWQEQLHQIVERAFADNADGAHDLAHILRVWTNCEAIARLEEPCDYDVLIAAAFLHDVFLAPKDAPDRHLASAKAAEEAAQLLPPIGFPIAKLAAVQHAIEAHSFSAQVKPTTLEARIVQDGDRLDSLGAIGIARTFYVAGKMSSQLIHPSDPLAQNRPLDDKTFAYDHFARKLFVIADTMTTETGKSLAKARTEAMRQFCDRLLGEVNA